MELVSYSNKAFEAENENGHPPDRPEDPEPIGGRTSPSWIETVQKSVGTWYQKHRRALILATKFTLLALYMAYLAYALYYRFGDEGSLRLLVCTILGVVILILKLMWGPMQRRCSSCCPSVSSSREQKTRTILRWTLGVSMAIFIVVWTGVDVGRKDTRNLVSLSGIAFFVIVLYITSVNPAKVNWHPVFWGMAIQYVFALLIIRTQWGYDAFEWLGDRFTELLEYSDEGAIFVFGEKYTDHVFAMKVLPVIVYFSSLISILYYLGAMQAIIRVIGRFLAFCMDTSATESINAAGNIFIGQTEAPLMIRPFMPKMTNSEIHAVMTGGFATVAGSVLGAYIAYGVKANYLLGASVMSAPAALAMSKLTYPETETTDVNEEDVYKLIQTQQSKNLIEAASMGASTAISLVANVAVNVMAFLAILAFLNATLVWFGDRVGVDGLTFEFLCSYVFYPMAFLMGVDEQDCRRVAQLIGYKTFMNEFVAYVEMGKLLDNLQVYHNYTTAVGANASYFQDGLDIILPAWNDTRLVGGFMTARSEAIATYALCGFSNLGSMGIQLGAFSAMIPSRKADLSRMVLRAMIAGNVACFMTACIAVIGVLIVFVKVVHPTVATRLHDCGPDCAPSTVKRTRKITRWTLYVGMAVFIILWTILDVGIAFFVISLYITSVHRTKVNWHPVFWGMAMQYVFALLIIRTQWGFQAFDWLGDRVTTFLGYTDAGSRFVFGEKFTDHVFAFQVLPVIVFFGAFMSVLYHVGVMQAVIGVGGRCLAFCMGTSPTESINTVGNIFVSQTEAPLMIKPFIERMTRSELHAVSTGGFATVAGSIMGAYISYGVKASYLLGASVMSAPGALAMSKLTYPETEVNDINAKEVYQLKFGSSNNMFEAIAVGASTAVKLIANIAANLIAIIALLEFLNATLQWFGDRAGVDGLTFQFLCSYVFYPMAFLMGVDASDCRRVARLIGIKTFTNEFVAYIEMGKLIDNGHVYSNYTTTVGNNARVLQDGLDVILPEWNNTRLEGGCLHARSEMIATYALCGFSNLSCIGIQLGSFGAMAPSRRTDFSRLVLRALIAGSVTCFMNACMAGKRE
ncbi:hypothetical protein BaRGS_00022891 [Batillaria attramentaria]|uniref:Sodium/nucleoside cotransporter n=1 Tax=Batillaria attramentaria TaxID=370345 RepID=A0ABD0KFR7_9CAEN